MNYQAPLQDMLFAMQELAGLSSVSALQGFEDYDLDTAQAVMQESAKFCAGVVAPLNVGGDKNPSSFKDGAVTTAPGFKEAYAQFTQGGWQGVIHPTEHGGQGFPKLIATPCAEMLHAASLSFALCPMLTDGAIEALLVAGSEELKRKFVGKLISGQWTGTMNLTEPQAGSDLAAVRASAQPQVDGTYKVFGTKIFITYGEHDMAENIIHLVLAKIPAPDGKLVAGTRGISLFIVPKKLVGTDGELTGERNDVALAGLNHKLGWRGTVNTLLNFGEGKYPVNGQAGAIGYLVGKPGEGLGCMFHMMNEARIGVGIAATMLGMAGYFASLDYAKTRPQGRAMGAGGKDVSQPQLRIIEHADVKRMLLAQKSYCEGALALELYCARLVDEQHTGAPEHADEARLLLEVLTPIAKSWPSEWCLEANSLAIQIHGGYGYTRDFPVEQYWRDNRLNMIHEGTHGIQAMDLLGRKVLMESGRGLALLAARITDTAQRASGVAALSAYAAALLAALQQVGSATKAAWATGKPVEALANAVPYMQAFGHTVLAWIWLDVALAVQAEEAGASSAASTGRLAAARYFYHYELPKIGAWLQVVNSRDSTCADLAEDAF